MDLNFVIPELVSGIQYKKGPYFVQDGDFTTAGSANINYVNVLDRRSRGSDGGSYRLPPGPAARVSPKLGEGHLLYALETVFSNGPVEKGDNFRKYNGVLRYSVGDARSGFAVTAMGYSANWDSTDQVARAGRRRGPDSTVRQPRSDARGPDAPLQPARASTSTPDADFVGHAGRGVRRSTPS